MTSLFYFVAGAAITVLVSNWGQRVLLQLRRVISWKSFFSALTDRKVLSAVMEESDQPDVIIGVNDGIVPASILATNLGLNELYYVHAPPESHADGSRKKPTVDLGNLSLVGGRKVLIVDNHAYTGQTMQAVYDYVLALEGAQKDHIRRLALFVYDTPMRKIAWEVPAPRKISKHIRRTPWAFTRKSLSLYDSRNQ